MTGPENYREAERVAERAYHYIYGDGADPVTGAALAALAQAHALLALAAATALPKSPPDELAWHKVAAIQPPTAADDDVAVDA